MFNFGAKTKVIDDKEFKVEPFNVRTAFKMQAKLARIFGPAIGGLFAGGQGLDSNVDFPKLLGDLFTELTEEKADELMVKLFERAYVIHEGQDIPLKDNGLNIAFMGNIMSLYKVIWFVLEVNYPDFLSQVGNFGSLLKTYTNSSQEENVKKSVRRSANSVNSRKK